MKRAVGIALMRTISALFFMFFLFIPLRERREWSVLYTASYYLAVVTFIALASIQIPRVTRSLQLTVLLVCITAMPFAYTVPPILLTLLRLDFAGTDSVTWVGISLLLTLELLLPLVLLLEFNYEKRAAKQTPPTI